MKFSLNNFLTEIKQIVMGGGREKDGVTPTNDAGYLHDVSYPLAAVRADPASVALTDSTGGTPSGTLAAITAGAAYAQADLVAIKNALASLATSVNALNSYATNNLSALETNLRGLTAAASTTAVGVVNFTIPRDYDEATDTMALKIMAAMAGATDTPAITVACYRKRAGSAIATVSAGVAGAALSNTAAVQEFTFNSKGLLRDDVLTFIITVAAHTTDALYVYSVEPVYRSTLVSYHETDGSRDGKTGNPLR